MPSHTYRAHIRVKCKLLRVSESVGGGGEGGLTMDVEGRKRECLKLSSVNVDRNKSQFNNNWVKIYMNIIVAKKRGASAIKPRWSFSSFEQWKKWAVALEWKLNEFFSIAAADVWNVRKNRKRIQVFTREDDLILLRLFEELMKCFHFFFIDN